MEYEQLGRKIREERIKKRITQEQLAELVDVTCSYIGQIERNERKPSLQKVEKLAQVLDISVDCLIGFKFNKEARDVDEKVKDIINTLNQDEKLLLIDIIKVIKKYELR